MSVELVSLDQSLNACKLKHAIVKRCSKIMLSAQRSPYPPPRDIFGSGGTMPGANDAKIKVRIMPEMKGPLRLDGIDGRDEIDDYDEIESCEEIDGCDEIDDEPRLQPRIPDGAHHTVYLVRGVVLPFLSSLSPTFGQRLIALMSRTEKHGHTGRAQDKRPKHQKLGASSENSTRSKNALHDIDKTKLQV